MMRPTPAPTMAAMIPLTPAAGSACAPAASRPPTARPEVARGSQRAPEVPGQTGVPRISGPCHRRASRPLVPP